MPVTRYIQPKRRITVLACFYVVLFFAISCGKSDNTSVNANEEPDTRVEVDLSLDISSLKKSETTSTASSRQASFTADQIMQGQLSALNTDTSAIVTFDWSVYLDEDSWSVQSNKTIILSPGTYEFSLLLTDGNQQYAGSSFQVITEGTVDIPMTIRPIVGNSISDVSLVGTLADFKFLYDDSELSAAGFSDPQLGVILDSGNEEIFSINPSSGISDNYINLTAGAHQIQLRLYDGSIQRGRSIVEQESIVIAAGLNISMDLVALQGETKFALTEEGGDATFTFTIPDDVINEAGGVQNLEVQFSMVGSRNALHENTLPLNSSPFGDYEASLTLTDIQVDFVNISLTFKDISKSPEELLGSCNQSTTLDTVQRSISCDLTLRRRAVVSGSLLATLGINVLSNLGAPIPGATVSKDGSILGISGSGMFGAPGYIKLFMNAGAHILKAETALETGIGMAVMAPLSVNNLDIVVENRPSFTNVVYEKEVSAGSEIYIMDADGLNQTRLTDTAESTADQNNNTNPQYSMYLNQIVFSSNRNGSDEWSDLFAMQLDGTGITPLTADFQKHDYFTLSIDGLIYYSHWNSNMDVYFMNLDGSGKTPLPWSSTPDVLIWDINISNQVLYSQDGVVHRIDSFGTGDIVVGEKVGDLVFLGPSWSPDGMKILVSRHDSSSHELWIMEADGTNRVQIDLGSLDVGTGQHRFSPDGSQILFSAAEPGNSYDIYVANVDGTGITNLTNTAGVSETHPFPF